MSARALIAIGLLLALGLAGCGKYGPPQRSRPAPAAQAASPAPDLGGTPPAPTAPVEPSEDTEADR